MGEARETSMGKYNRFNGRIDHIEKSLKNPEKTIKLIERLDEIEVEIIQDRKNIADDEKLLQRIDSLRRMISIKEIQTDHKAMIKLFETSEPMTYAKVVKNPDDKVRLETLITERAPHILHEELESTYPIGTPDAENKKLEALPELLIIYMNLLVRLLPTFFGADPTNPGRLFIPNTGTPEGRLMVDLAMRAVYAYMKQVKSISESTSVIADSVVPRTPATIIARLATFGLTFATLQAISPFLFNFIDKFTTGSPLSLDAIKTIMTEAFKNAGYISAFLFWCNSNKNRIIDVGYRIFKETIGRGIPDEPEEHEEPDEGRPEEGPRPRPRPRTEFIGLMDRLSDSTAARQIESVTGRIPDFNYDFISALDRIAWFCRSACVKHTQMMGSAVTGIPRALTLLSKNCSRLVQSGRELLHKSATRYQSRADEVSQETYDSFSDMLIHLSELPEYSTLTRNHHFNRCMDILHLHNPNPHHINEARLTLHDARYHLENPAARYYTPPELSQTANMGSPVHHGILEDKDALRSDDILGPNGEILEKGDVLPADNASYSAPDSQGRLNPSDVFENAQAFQVPPAQSNRDYMDEDHSIGGRSRSRKRSVSKRTRRKGVAKKQKSNKNKRQSRRKVRRASSRKGRK